MSEAPQSEPVFSIDDNGFVAVDLQVPNGASLRVRSEKAEAYLLLAILKLLEGDA